MHKTHVFRVLTAVVLVWSVSATAHWAQLTECELRLEQSGIYEKLVDEAAELEGQLFSLEAACRGGKCLRDAQLIRAAYLEYVETLLNRSLGLTELVRGFSDLVTRETILRMQVMGPGALSAAPAAALTLMDLVENPEKLTEDVPIPIGRPELKINTVSFAKGLLEEFWELAEGMQRKFLRAIVSGVVGPVGQSGVKWLAGSKTAVEVKTFGGGGRLFGCLQNGKLTLLRLEPDHVGTATVNRYASLCH